jgi:predicted membrane-bound spermidine synthase
MAIELSEITNESGADKETFFMLSGAALVLLGTGMILSSPVVRRYLGQIGVGNLLSGVVPDFDKYLKLRNM